MRHMQYPFFPPAGFLGQTMVDHFASIVLPHVYALRWRRHLDSGVAGRPTPESIADECYAIAEAMQRRSANGSGPPADDQAGRHG